MEINKSLPCNRDNYGNQRSISSIKYIVIHYTGNNNDKAESNCKYFQTSNRGASAHYFVDATNIYQSVEDGVVAWSVGGRKYPSCSTTGGGKWYGECTNNNSISIEMCNCVNGVPSKTRDNVKYLVGILMNKYNIEKDNIIRHFDVVGKTCPAPLVDDIKWKEFKKYILEFTLTITEIKINLFGKIITANGIVMKDCNFVKLRDLETNKLQIGWNGKNILINDEVFIPNEDKTIVYKDNNYIHIRELGKLGFKIDWDSKANMIVVSK